nr:O-antigen ligase family protein [Mariprofundus sp. NF]
MPDLLPAWQGAKSVTLLFLCIAILCFPFSVAATNVALGIVLALGLLSGIWWQGLMALWQAHRGLVLALIAYLALVVIGLIWSIDYAWGLKILGRHWFWLLLPIVVSVLSMQGNRQVFLAVASVGFTANLLFCVLQANGLADGHSASGSSAENATGHIGHTSFGFIYGIWAAWLIHLGLLCRNRYSWLLWGLSLWALVMVFMAQGKSGYIVTLAVMLFVMVKWLQEGSSRRMLISLASILFLVGLTISFGPGKDRLLGTWHALTGNVNSQSELNWDQTSAISSATARLEWWKVSYETWLNKPIIGFGTGSFPKAVADWKANHVDEWSYDVPIVHPHNQYLLSMVRWGVIGLVLLLTLLYFWVREGISKPWRNSTVMPLITLTGAALLVHGLSSASMEEHFSTIFAVLMLSAGLSETLGEKDT